MIDYRMILLVAGVALIGVGGTLVFYHGYYTMDYVEYPIQYNISPGTLGFIKTDELLDFGRIAPRDTAYKEVHVVSPQDTRLVVEVHGAAAQYTYPDTSEVMLRAGEEITIRFATRITPNAQEGQYVGEARFYFYRW